MNFTPRYLGRGSWLARRDPRLLVIAVACYVFAAIQVWDIRLMLGLVAIALVYYRAARIPFRAVRPQWTLVIVFVSLLAIGNGIIASGRVQRLPEDATIHLYFLIPLLGTPVSAESVTFAATQFLRFIGMAAVGFPLAFSVSPSDFGVTFARLGLPYRFAFAVDLTWRFIPSLAADFRTTMDAQRVRGMEFDLKSGSLLGRVRRVAPLFVPAVINAIVGAEDTIDAMDLRSFGTGRRTWLRELRYGWVDRLVLAGFLVLLVGATVLGFTTSSALLWVPPFMIPG